ncbi:MAG: DUF4115 domain-containing protein [Anaerolineales bacterium]|nr:DUF4115 domain-containing protein [Anaerolineales bacterium]
MAEIRPSIGEELRRARESRNLSIEKVSRETHIRLGYLQAIEAGDLDALPSPTQARGFMRAYASYLDLKLDDMLAEAANAGQSVVPDREPAVQEPLAGTAPDIDSPDQIFAEIGGTLSKQRALLGFSILDVERQTHIKAHYIQALESGSMSSLPSPVQGRGMLSNYASFLGLDPDPLLLRFADGLQAGLASRRPPRSRGAGQEEYISGTSLRRLISGDMLFGGLLIFLLAIFLIWGIGRISNLTSQEETPPTELSLGGLLLNSPTPEPAQPTETPQPAAGGDQPVSEEIVETPDESIPPPAEGAVQVYVVVHQRAWLQAIVDGQVEFSGRVLPGAAFPFSGDETVEILTGNGVALEVYYNQQNIGRLGFYGEVVHRVFAEGGIFTPTPTNSPTPTATPAVTATPTPEEASPTE